MTGIGLLNKNNVQIARENYLAAQKALAESEKLLAERVEREAQAKIKFNEVQLELAKLNNENMNMVSLHRQFCQRPRDNVIRHRKRSKRF